MTEIIKVGILGIVGVLIAIQFKQTKPEFSVYIGIGVGLLIFFYGVNGIEAMLASFNGFKKYLEGSWEYLIIVLKVTGITYICEFSSDICKDAGYGAVAGQIEILGKLSILFAGLPILFAMMEQIQKFTI